MKQPSAGGLPSTKWSVSSQPATTVVNALTERADELTDDLIKAIAGAPKLSDFAWIPAPIGPSVGSVRSVVAAMADPTVFDPQSAIQSGADQARQRGAVPSLIEGARVGFRPLWQINIGEAARHPALDAQALQLITANLCAVEDLFETAKFS